MPTRSGRDLELLLVCLAEVESTGRLPGESDLIGSGHFAATPSDATSGQSIGSVVMRGTELTKEALVPTRFLSPGPSCGGAGHSPRTVRLSL
jgi:hypothetical protein